MNRLYKALLFLFSLSGFAVSLCLLSFLYPIPFLSDILNGYFWDFSAWLYAFAVYIIAIGIFFLLVMLAALFFPCKPGDLVLAKSKGTLQFSKHTVESTVRYSFSDVDGITSSRIRAKIGKKPENTKIYIKLSLTDPSRLLELTETVQEKIESAMQSSLGFSAKSVNIRVTGLTPGNKIPDNKLPNDKLPDDTAQNENSEELVKSGRVI